MNVSDAIATRKSIRAFTDQAVPVELMKELLEKAARAPSGGNLQPWRVFVITSERMAEFQRFLADSEIKDTPAYQIYPSDLKSPYRDSRFKVGEDMYALLGIGREDKAGRYAHLAKNYSFFGAPTGFFCFVDRQMGPPQWSDLGMFLQNFMLLAREAGLHTCAQEAWAMRANTVSAYVQADEDLMLFCGMALGYADEEKPVNTLVSDRESLDVWARFM